MARILITGKNGYIAKGLANKLKEKHSIIGIGRDDFDLTDREATNKWFKDKYFDVIIHTAISGGNRLKQEDGEVFFKNLSMFYNLLSNQDKFTQLISFGSGAELGYPTDPYGLSKDIINRIIQNETKLNNIRIFAVFDENELDRRFITPNIKRYINKQPLILHQNKLMDFFYMEDLVSIVEYIIFNPQVKEIDCTYPLSYSLYDIAFLINELSDYKCEIKVEQKGLGKHYTGEYKNLNIPFIGLERAIKQIYEKLN
jgi:nucleoside-diphosphate-sugar epimerase